MPPWGRTSRTRQGLVALATLCTAKLCTTKLALAEDTGLSIETGSPDALCPELGSTRAAVSRRLGALRLPDGSSGYRARYTIGHAPVGSPRDFVRLELFGPEGALQLSRDLPLEGESCSTMAEVIALVLDRYFSALLAGEPEEEVPVGSPTATPVPPSGVAPGTPASPPEPTTASPVPRTSDGLPNGTVTRAGPDRLALLAFELAFRNPAQPALGARAMTEPWPSIYLGAALHVELMSDNEDLADGGEVSSRNATLRAYVAWGPRLGPVHTYIGPGFRFGVSRGSARDLEDGNVELGRSLRISSEGSNVEGLQLDGMVRGAANSLVEVEASSSPAVPFLRCVEGDRGAWRQLHRQYYPVAAAFLRKLGVHERDLDDACQEVFLQMFRYLSRFRGEAGPEDVALPAVHHPSPPHPPAPQGHPRARARPGPLAA